MFAIVVVGGASRKNSRLFAQDSDGGGVGWSVHTKILDHYIRWHFLHAVVVDRSSSIGASRLTLCLRRPTHDAPAAATVACVAWLHGALVTPSLRTLDGRPPSWGARAPKEDQQQQQKGVCWRGCAEKGTAAAAPMSMMLGTHGAHLGRGAFCRGRRRLQKRRWRGR